MKYAELLKKLLNKIMTLDSSIMTFLKNSLLIQKQATFYFSQKILSNPFNLITITQFLIVFLNKEISL
jgi:hypothetical protein